MGGLARPGEAEKGPGGRGRRDGHGATGDSVSFNIVNSGNFKATKLVIMPIIWGEWLPCVLFFGIFTVRYIWIEGTTTY